MLPIHLHTQAIAVGLLPSKVLLPPFSAFNPFSIASSFGALAWGRSVTHFAHNVFLSPLLLDQVFGICYANLASRCVWTMINSLFFPFWSNSYSSQRSSQRFRRPGSSVLIRLRESMMAPIGKVFRTFNWAFVSKSELTDLAIDDEVHDIRLVSDLCRSFGERACLQDRLLSDTEIDRVLRSDTLEQWQSVGSMMRGHDPDHWPNFRIVQDSPPPTATNSASSARIQSIDRGEGHLHLEVDFNIREEVVDGDTDQPDPEDHGVLVEFADGRTKRLGPRRPALTEYSLEVLAISRRLTTPVVHLVMTSTMMPLKVMLLRHVATTFVGGSRYMWVPWNGIILWQPQTKQEWATWAGRLLFCAGLEFAVGMARWIVEANIIVWRRRRARRAKARLRG